MTKYRLCHARDLDRGLIAAWADLQASLPALASPFFHPAFTDACAAVRRDARVIVVEDQRGPAGFFPFQAGALGSARPIGGAVSDYHGAIAGADLDWSPIDLLRAARVRVWRFDHLIASQDAFAPFHVQTRPSLTVNLHDGYDAYAEASRKAGSKHVQKIEAMVRKIEREIGPLRFEAQSRDPGVLRAVFEWKSAQFRATDKPDLFAHSWSRALLERIAAVDGPSFGGMLSSLHAGDTLIAAHMGMRSGSVWHYWFPAYSEQHSRYSPGMVLLLRIVQDAPARGLRLVDMGKGDSFYKDRFANGSIPVAEGRVEVPSILNTARRFLQRAETWAAGRRFAAPLALPMRLLRRIEYRTRTN